MIAIITYFDIFSNLIDKKIKKNRLFSKTSIIVILVFLVLLTSIPSTIGLIEVNKSIISDSEIFGLYYLRDDDIAEPMNDEGTMKKEVPIENESTFCGMYVLFHFAQEDTYVETNTVNSIYFHIWQKTPQYAFEGWEFDLGYCNLGTHNWYMNESVHINTSECISVVDNYRLVQTLLHPDPELATFKGDDIYNFTVKSMGNCPVIRNNPNQYSFVILNIEDNQTLLELDRDSDHINDYDELYIYYTNPFDADTDDDGATDCEEVTGESSGYWNSDPNNYSDTTEYKILPNVKITKPDNSIYIKNNKILPFFVPIIIGNIDIEAIQTNKLCNITKVEFYIDEELKATVDRLPYSWTWEQRSFFGHEIKVVVYDNFENYAIEKINVWRIL